MEVFSSFHQFIESSLFFESSVSHHKDFVISSHQFFIQCVCDDDSCDAGKIKDIGRDLICRLGIQSRRDLVSQKDGGILKETSGDRYPLLLTTGQAVAVLSAKIVFTTLADQFPQIRADDRLLHFLFGKIPEHRDVVLNGRIKDEHILLYR